MRPLRALAAASALLALGACTTVGPNYSLPKSAAVRAPAAQGQFLGATGGAVSQAPVPDNWWRLYDDPVLNALQVQALAANTDLRVAAANLAKAEAVVGEARAAQGPKASLEGSLERAQESGQTFLLNERIPAENLADVGIRASYQLDLFGQLRRALEAAHADAEASHAALELARVTVAGEVTEAYLEACSAGEELAVANHSVDLQARNLSVTEKLTAAGRGTALDVTRAKAQLDQVSAGAPVFEARRRAALYRLAALTGRPPAEFPRAVAACAALPKLKQPIPVGDGAALLQRRPDVRQAERRLAAATARIGVATAALYPQVSLGVSAGTTGILGDLFTGPTNRWGFGPLISWTLPTGAERARVREASADADAALARFDGVVLTALRETETSLDAYAQELQRNVRLRAARDEAAVASEQANRLYRAGRTPYLTGLDASRTLANAEQALAASDAQVAADQVRVFLSLGGGWGASELPPPQSGGGGPRAEERVVEGASRAH